MRFGTMLMIITTAITSTCNASMMHHLACLKNAYPSFIANYDQSTITWHDGDKTNLDNGIDRMPSLREQVAQPLYSLRLTNHCQSLHPQNDAGRIRNKAFFGKMYGMNQEAVHKNLVTIYWMPHYFGYRYPLLVTSINHVDQHLADISAELEILAIDHPRLLKYLANPGGGYYWRRIENTPRRSPHSYGIAFDLNADHANYWLWDTGSKTNLVNSPANFAYKNTIPCAIVAVFERHGFIWGGKWQHYDTMHFEYRPEIIASRCSLKRI